jgi:glycine hydroxymethyltransferase
MEGICRRLGLKIIPLPYDFARFDLSIDETNSLLRGQEIDFLFVAPSDLLHPPAFDALEIPDRVTVIYDATQTLGLIASGALPNPLYTHPRFIILGGTHKTLPGPSSGLIFTANSEIAKQIDGTLNPKFLRHSQPHQIASLAACLIEHMQIGRAYSRRIQRFTRVLSRHLIDGKLEVLGREDVPSQTHQIFLKVNADSLDDIYKKFCNLGITLNIKRKRLFSGAGLRLGVQEIARYKWEEPDLSDLAEVLNDTLSDKCDLELTRERVKKMALKNEFRADLLTSHQSKND